MEKSIFTNRFRRALLREQPEMEAPPVDDAAALAGSFEDPAELDQLNNEVGEVSEVSTLDSAKVLATAEKWSAKIESVLSTMNALHDQFVNGPLSTLNADIKGISKINEELAKLQQALKGRPKDAIIAQKNDRKV